MNALSCPHLLFSWNQYQVIGTTITHKFSPCLQCGWEIFAYYAIRMLMVTCALQSKGWKKKNEQKSANRCRLVFFILSSIHLGANNKCDVAQMYMWHIWHMGCELLILADFLDSTTYFRNFFPLNFYWLICRLLIRLLIWPIFFSLVFF